MDSRRLDKDSEGLLQLTVDGDLQKRISHLSIKLVKQYLVQVDGDIDEKAIEKLRKGVQLKDGPARATQVAVPSRRIRSGHVNRPSGFARISPPAGCR